MPLVDKQKVLDSIESKRKELDTEFDAPETTDQRKHEINGSLTVLHAMRRDVTDMPDAVAKVED